MTDSYDESEDHNEEMERHWEKKAKLAMSILNWRMGAQLALDQTITVAIQNGSPVAFSKFKTPGNRPCVILLGIGDEVAEAVESVFEQIQEALSSDED